MSQVPKIAFNNGLKIPLFGLGTWLSEPGKVTQAVKDAIDIGYRHIDCAHLYGNEKEVGEAISTKIKEGVIKREDLFVTSKLWNTFHRADLVEVTAKQSLSDLGLDYLDLYLIHWPVAYKEGDDLFPKKDDKIIFSNAKYVDTWKAMEELVRKGLVKSIGISNFNKRQVERILQVATIKPVNNQVECHPYLNQSKLFDFCKSKGISLTAYSPLGSPDRPWVKKGEPQLMDDPKLRELAKRYNKSVAQVLLRYQTQRGVITIPKSITKSRIAENFNIFDFQLQQADMDYIHTFDCNGRVVPFEDALGNPEHPFENDEY